MTKRKKIASLAFTGLAAAGTTAAVATPAGAASGTWTVTPGGHFVAANSGGTSLSDVTTHAKLTCARASASGSLAASATGAPANLGTIAKAGFGSTSSLCNGPLGLKFTAALTSAATLQGNSFSNGITHGTVTGVHAKITGANGFACSATVTGSISASYNNTTGQLTVDPKSPRNATLTVAATNGQCFGAINPGDKAWFHAAYVTSPPQTVTGP